MGILTYPYAILPPYHLPQQKDHPKNKYGDNRSGIPPDAHFWNKTKQRVVNYAGKNDFNKIRELPDANKG